MKKMKRMKRLVVGILVSIMMTLQLCNVTLANVAVPVTTIGDFSQSFEKEPMDVPDQVRNAQSYKEIPVYYEKDNKNSTKAVETISYYLEKTGGKDQSKGYATFKVKGYAYRNGTNVTLGILYGYYNKDGQWVQQFLDQANAVSNLETLFDNPDSWRNDGSWEGWKEYKYTTTVEGFIFTPGQEDHSGTRVRYLTNTSLGHGNFCDRDSVDVLLTPFEYTGGPGAFNVDRKVEEVEGLKNVWQVTLTISGKKQDAKPSATDVVLVLDRSGSMKDGVQGGGTRAQIVEKASKSLIDDLTANANTRVAVVSFGGGTVAKGTKKSFEHYNAGTMNPFSKEFKANWGDFNTTYYSDYKVNSDFTNNAGTLKSAISSALGSPNGGTPMSLGIIKAGLMLKNSGEDTNKIIILLSDGVPTYTRDGSGNGSSMTDSVKKDTISAASSVQDMGIDMYTIAAGASVGSDGKALLKSCATSKDYAYSAGDKLTELSNVMNSIGEEIKQTASETKLNEKLNDQFMLALQADKDFSNVTRVKDVADLASVNWKNTSAAYTSGSVEALANGQVQWNIGEVSDEIPAVLSYRIEMTSGKLGVPYDVYNETAISYTDQDNINQKHVLPNEQIKAKWAQASVYYVDSRSGAVLSDPIGVWYDVPDDYALGSLVFDYYKTRINPDTMEVINPNPTDPSTPSDPKSPSDPKAPTVPTSPDDKDKIVSPVTDPVAVPTVDKLMEKPEDSNVPEGIPGKEVDDVKTPVPIPLEIKFEAVSGNGYNFLQPGGVSNAAASIEIVENCVKDLSYTVDLENVVNAELDGKTVFTCGISPSDINVQVIKGTDEKLQQGIDYTYTVSGSKVTVKFTDGVEYPKASKLVIAVYFKTDLNGDIPYKNSESSYVTTLVNNKVNVDTEIKFKTIVEYKKNLEDGTIEPVWGDDSKTGNIPLTYAYIPKVY